jgi:hypothetical protein
MGCNVDTGEIYKLRMTVYITITPSIPHVSGRILRLTDESVQLRKPGETIPHTATATELTIADARSGLCRNPAARSPVPKVIMQRVDPHPGHCSPVNDLIGQSISMNLVATLAPPTKSST